MIVRTLVVFVIAFVAVFCAEFIRTRRKLKKAKEAKTTEKEPIVIDLDNKIEKF